MRIKAAAQHSPARQIPLEGDADLAVPEGHGSVDLGLLALTNGTPEDKDASWVHARLGDYLLGYDLDPDIFKALLKRQGALAASLPADDPVLLELSLIHISEPTRPS